MQINRNTGIRSMMKSPRRLANSTPIKRRVGTPYGGKMTRAEPRIIVAAVAVFTALAGLGASIRGLLSDSPGLVRYGAAALVLGVGCFVALLNITTRDDA
ncbi:DUF2964 family protein [Paraburkholderia phytofirmans]|nr:DUF2964 family protein [Paraburkholderia phytofirmans]